MQLRLPACRRQSLIVGRQGYDRQRLVGKDVTDDGPNKKYLPAGL
jgi:hypothetical protein